MYWYNIAICVSERVLYYKGRIMTGITVLIPIVSVLAGLGGGYTIWGGANIQKTCSEFGTLHCLEPTNTELTKTAVTRSSSSYNNFAPGDEVKRSSIEDWEISDVEDGHGFSVSWNILQSYQYKNVLFEKACKYERDPPDWSQSTLMSGASRNEAVAMMSRAALMKSDPINTAQLPYKFDFTLVKPVFIGDVELFTFDVTYKDDEKNSACGDAIVTGTGRVDGKIYTVSTIKYRCMFDKKRRLVEQGFTLSENL